MIIPTDAQKAFAKSPTLNHDKNPQLSKHRELSPFDKKNLQNIYS